MPPADRVVLVQARFALGRSIAPDAGSARCAGGIGARVAGDVSTGSVAAVTGAAPVEPRPSDSEGPESALCAEDVTAGSCSAAGVGAELLGSTSDGGTPARAPSVGTLRVVAFADDWSPAAGRVAVGSLEVFDSDCSAGTVPFFGPADSFACSDWGASNPGEAGGATSELEVSAGTTASVESGWAVLEEDEAGSPGVTAGVATAPAVAAPAPGWGSVVLGCALAGVGSAGTELGGVEARGGKNRRGST
jgi:hypothetical protein